MEAMTPTEADRAARAWSRYRRLMRWMTLVSLLVVAAVLAWLWATDTPMPLHMVIATIAGVFLTMLLGTGLMGLLFVSRDTGHDEGSL